MNNMQLRIDNCDLQARWVDDDIFVRSSVWAGEKAFSKYDFACLSYVMAGGPDSEAIHGYICGVLHRRGLAWPWIDRSAEQTMIWATAHVWRKLREDMGYLPVNFNNSTLADLGSLEQVAFWKDVSRLLAGE